MPNWTPALVAAMIHARLTDKTVSEKDVKLVKCINKYECDVGERSSMYYEKAPRVCNNPAGK